MLKYHCRVTSFLGGDDDDDEVPIRVKCLSCARVVRPLLG